MDECCTPRCKAIKLLILGIIIILIKKYTVWDMWIVIGGLLIIKAIMIFIMPICPCHTKFSKPQKKK
jgi:hypothetical protein